MLWQPLTAAQPCHWNDKIINQHLPWSLSVSLVFAGVTEFLVDRPHAITIIIIYALATPPYRVDRIAATEDRTGIQTWFNCTLLLVTEMDRSVFMKAKMEVIIGRGNRLSLIVATIHGQRAIGTYHEIGTYTHLGQRRAHKAVYLDWGYSVLHLCPLQKWIGHSNMA